MSKKILTDEEVEEEIKRLTEDEDVRLARAELRINYKSRQYLRQLRYLKRRGQKIRNNPEYSGLVEAFGYSEGERKVKK